MPVIEVENLSKRFRTASKDPGLLGTLKHFVRRRYKDLDAVKQISFQLEAGEIVGFLGPNGAGKTTALKMLTGLIHPTSGRVVVAGHTPVRREAAFLTRISLVMGQKQQLMWDLPAMDSLRINAAVYEIPQGEFRARVAELSQMLELDSELKRPVRKLSLGERMKAELMAALLHRPEILFLDEPTLGLDVNAQAAVREFLRQYNRKYGATILLTSHYMADISALCKRTLLIHQGRIMFDGSLDQIVQRVAPYREIRLETRQPCDAADLAALGEVESVEGCVARLIVRRENLTTTMTELLNRFDITDMTVSDPPIEQVIGRVFKDGMVADATANGGDGIRV